MNKRVLAFSILAALIVATSVHAQSPREQLQQMVEQLQKTPNDNALRERLIKFGAEIKPPPAVSDEAIRYEGRGQFAFANAKSEDDFLEAAKEYEKAVTVAPWIQGYYSDLCKIYEKAGKLEDAKRHCGFYLIGLSDPAQITDVKRRIAGLEFGIEKAEKANSTEARIAREKQAEQRFIASLEGAKYDCHETRDEFSAEKWQIEITQGKIHGFNVTTWSRLPNKPVGFRGPWLNGTVQGRVSRWNDRFGDVDTRVEIYDDHLVVNQDLNPPITVTCRRR